MVCSECREEVSMETLRTEPSARLRKQRAAMLAAHFETSAK